MPSNTKPKKRKKQKKKKINLSPIGKLFGKKNKSKTSKKLTIKMKKQLLVGGYIKINLHGHDLIIPIDIMSTIATFCSLSDEWSVKYSNKSLIISNDGSTLTREKSQGDDFWNAFGTQKIGNGDYKKWRLKVDVSKSSKKPSSQSTIGIMESSKKLLKIPMSNFANECNDYGDGFGVFLGNYDAYHNGDNSAMKSFNVNSAMNKGFTKTDIIEIELNMKKNDSNKNPELRFILNGDNCGLIDMFKIKRNKQYVLGITMYNDEKWTILE